MRKILAPLITLGAMLGAIAPTPAQVAQDSYTENCPGGQSSIPWGGLASDAYLDCSPPSCSDSSATAWVNAVVSAGGTVSGTQATKVCNLIVALKAHSSWNSIDRLWLLASENTQQALIDIKNLGVATAVGSPTFAPSNGYTGASGKYLESNFAGSIDGVNFVRNDNGFTAYIMNNRTSGIGGATLGYYDSVSTGSQSFLNPITTGPLVQYDMNNLGFNVNGGAPTTARGCLTAVRTASNALAAYKNNSATPIATSTEASMALVALEFYIFARNNANTADVPSTDTASIIAFHSGLGSAANVAQFQFDLNAYMTDLGTNVYAN